MKEVKALLVDDEEPLRRFLRTRLSEVWPELTICGEAGNGQEAIQLVDRHHPDIVFLDIRMPGLNGLEVAKEIAGSCRVVFVTAYDRYAVEAFEAEAVDYLLKPVSTERLQKTVKRLREEIETDSVAPVETLRRLMARLSDQEGSMPLQYIRVQQGDAVRLIPVDEVIYFKAEDKYTVVTTSEREFLIRKSIKDLVGELDPLKFWQIHRSTIVSARAVACVSRSLTGRGVVKLKDRAETLKVSQGYMHLFRQM